MRIGELTLDKVINICEKCDEYDICPFRTVDLVKCCYKRIKYEKEHLDDELEVETNECSKN